MCFREALMELSESGLEAIDNSSHRFLSILKRSSKYFQIYRSQISFTRARSIKQSILLTLKQKKKSSFIKLRMEFS